MKKLISLSIIFISLSLSAQLETIVFKKNSVESSGKIIFINKDYLGFQASASANNKIKTNKGNITFTRRKEDNLFLIPRVEISSVKSGNNFKEFLISSNSKMNLFEDRLKFDEQNISKFRKLQLAGRWMSVLGSGVSLLGDEIKSAAYALGIKLETKLEDDCEDFVEMEVNYSTIKWMLDYEIDEDTFEKTLKECEDERFWDCLYLTDENTESFYKMIDVFSSVNPDWIGENLNYIGKEDFMKQIEKRVAESKPVVVRYMDYDEGEF